MTSHPHHSEANEEAYGEPTLEAAEADAAEQRADVVEPASDWTPDEYPSPEFEASEADAVEQLQEVEHDEDDYR